MEPVGLMGKQPDFLGTLSNLMSLKQQRQQLQVGAQQVQQGQLETQKQQAIQDFYKDFDPTEITAPDGSLDLNKAFSMPKFKSAGNAKSALAENLITIKQKQLEATNALANLDHNVVSQFGTGLGAYINDQDVKDDTPTGRAKTAEFIKSFGALDAEHAKIMNMYGMVVDHAPPGKLASSLRVIQQQAQSASEQQAQQNPRTGAIDNGPNVILTNTDVPTGAVSQTGTIAKGIAPTIGTAPNGQPGAITNSGRTFTPTTSNIPSASSQPPAGLLNQDGSHRTAAQDAPPPTAPAVVQDNYNKAVMVANDHIQNVREADEHYRTNVDISNKIRGLSKETNTGPLMSYLQEKIGTTNIQELGAYLDRQAAGLQTAMNLPHTNQGQDMAKDISGNVKYTPPAIQEKNDFNQSLVEGFHAYRKGLERVGGLAGNASPAAVNQFKSAWAEAFDPNVFRAKAAYSRSTEEGKAFIQTLSAQDAEKMLKDKKALDLLSQGKLPE